MEGLPLEMASAVVDRMDLPTRARFGRCSRVAHCLSQVKGYTSLRDLHEQAELLSLDEEISSEDIIREIGLAALHGEGLIPCLAYRMHYFRGRDISSCREIQTLAHDDYFREEEEWFRRALKKVLLDDVRFWKPFSTLFYSVLPFVEKIISRRFAVQWFSFETLIAWIPSSLRHTPTNWRWVLSSGRRDLAGWMMESSSGMTGTVACMIYEHWGRCSLWEKALQQITPGWKCHLQWAAHQPDPMVWSDYQRLTLARHRNPAKVARNTGVRLDPNLRPKKRQKRVVLNK